MSNQNKVTTHYQPTAKRPLRFENLHPGSYFRIVAEPSRGIRKSNDMRIYRKAVNGFYAEHPVTKAGCILMPQDQVMPMRLVRKEVEK
jgi:hypothetical protein